jgi:hypothetical protein
VDGIVHRYCDKIVHWDMNNEMLQGSFFKDRLGEDIVMWDFWACNCSRGANAGLARRDWRLNTAGNCYETLRDEWSTATKGVTDANDGLRRDSVYSRTTGMEFIVAAFNAARAKDPYLRRRRPGRVLFDARNLLLRVVRLNCCWGRRSGEPFDAR